VVVVSTHDKENSDSKTFAILVPHDPLKPGQVLVGAGTKLDAYIKAHPKTHHHKKKS
jgi:hypothetical protein